VRGLANPVLLRAAVVLFCSTFAFLLGLLFMRMLRKSISEEGEVGCGPANLETLPLHVYNTVIQQLRQQKLELLAQSQVEQQRARATEIFSQAVVSYLPTGVLIFGLNGLVKTSNPAAKQILGFASLAGMALDDVFRGTLILSPKNNDPDAEDTRSLADEVAAVLRDGGPRRQIQAEYETPSGESRTLSASLSLVPGPDGRAIGVACLIEELVSGRVVAQVSAEAAEQLLESAGNLSRHARELVENQDPAVARQLVESIAGQADRLSIELGELLPGRNSGRSVAVERAP